MSLRTRNVRKFNYVAARTPERSIWLENFLYDEPDCPPLEEHVTCDIAIVGGGYTGLWAALRIKELEPTRRVVLIEADVCGGGPSGRNGGFMDPWRAKYFAMNALMGNDEALRMIDLSVDALSSIADFCTAHQINAEITKGGGLWVAGIPSGMNSWSPTVDKLRALGRGDNYRDLSRQELHDLAGVDSFLGGIYDDDKAKVDPARLARGMRRVALEVGVEIYENTPLTGLDYSNPPRILTPNGEITADRVVLAIGPWSGQIRELKNSIAVIGTDMIATEPIPNRLENTGAIRDLVISDSRMMVNYFRTTSDGRLAWGFGGGFLGYGSHVGASLHGRSPRADFVEASLRHHYPQFSDVRISHSWTGPVDRSPTGVPYFSHIKVQPAIIYGTGYSGNGVVPSYVGGRILASMALNLEDEYGTSGLIQRASGTFPPEPVRWLGGQLVRLSIAKVEANDQAGRKSNLFHRGFKRLAPPGPGEPR